MKFLILLVFIAVANASGLTDEQIKVYWNQFKRDFQRTYPSNGEHNARRVIFETNVKRIAEHNSAAQNGIHTFTLKVNQFADKTTEEFSRQMNGYRSNGFRVKINVHTDEDVSALPATVDWRTKGLVTGVKDQGQCSNCWAFSAVASIEGKNYRKITENKINLKVSPNFERQQAKDTKKLVSLSEQNLIDCSQAEANQGCNFGGSMDQAFEYVINNKGIDTESSYPYKGSDEKCAYKPSSRGATVRNFTDIMTGSESGLQTAAANVGPISVAIDASQFSFQFYSSGVYDEPKCGNKQQDLCHGATVVDYGVESGADYWLVKNWWGNTWGEAGYIKMSRNKQNQCGISTDSSYPTGVN